MRAGGEDEIFVDKSIRPLVESLDQKVDVMANEVDDRDEDEEIVLGPEGIEGERYGLHKEDEFVRKLEDPVMPNKEEVDRHYVMGHLPYRSWCPVCVKSHGEGS